MNGAGYTELAVDLQVAAAQAFRAHGDGMLLAGEGGFAVGVVDAAVHGRRRE
jgi:hypothetical protein